MSEQLQLYICEHFRADTQAVLSSDNFNDVNVSYFSSRCSRPLPANKQLSSLPIFKENINDDKLLCACACMSTPDKTFVKDKNINQLHLDNCFQMFAPKPLINKLMREGAYVMTPDWLKNWKIWAKQWGDQEQARLMFSESVTKLVLLDTGIDTDCDTNLKDFSAYMNCPSETIPLGLDYYRLYLENEILNWRLKKKNNYAGKPDVNPKNIESDFAMALDLMSNLPRAEKEDELAKRIMDIFIMMFAAQKVNYLSIVNDEPINLWTEPAQSDDKETQERLLKCKQAMKVTNSGNGFCMAIGAGSQTLAVVEIEGIAFPVNMLKYQNLALAMSGVLALSIENSRYFQNIMEMNESLKGLNATKDKLFSIIAHDLRSPFNAILGFTEQLIQKIDVIDVKKRKIYLDYIYSSAKNTLYLLDDLLKWAQSQTGQISYKPEELVLSSIFQEVLKLSSSSAKKKNIALNHFQSEEIVVFADRNMIKTVLRNLISNAIKFTNPAGEIKLSAQPIDNCIRIKVSDNGVGMCEETRNKLFSAKTNETTNGTANEKGSGLGLIICKEFIEKHGGEIWVESELDKGSVFTFTIPVNKSN